MALDYSALGKRISNFRNASGLTQEQFGEKLNMSRKHISQVEAAISRPSLETLVDIANLLGISTDDLLVDSLTHSASTADSEIHRLLLDCNAIEQEILTHFLLHVSDVVELDVGEFAELGIDVAREGEVDGEQLLLLRDVFLADDEMRG